MTQLRSDRDQQIIEELEKSADDSEEQERGELEEGIPQIRAGKAAFVLAKHGQLDTRQLYNKLVLPAATPDGWKQIKLDIAEQQASGIVRDLENFMVEAPAEVEEGLRRVVSLRKGEVSVTEEAIRAAVPEPAGKEEARFTVSMDTVFKKWRSQQTIARIINVHRSNANLKWSDHLGDLIETLAAPGLFPERTQKLLAKLKHRRGVTTKVADAIFWGNTLHTILKHVDSIKNPDDKAKAIQIVLDWTRSNGWIKTKNNFVSEEILHRIAGGETGLGTVERSVYNILGMTDWVYLGKAARWLYRRVQLMTYSTKARSLAEALRAANPEEYARLRVQAAKEGPDSDIAKMLDSNADDVTLDAMGLHTLSSEYPETISPYLVKLLNQVKATAARAVREDPNPVPWISERERLAVQAKLVEKLSGIPDMHLHFMNVGDVRAEKALRARPDIGKTADDLKAIESAGDLRVQGTSQDVRILAHYGKTETEGFRSLAEADAALQKLGKEDRALSRIVAVDASTARLIEEPSQFAKLPKGSQYYVQYRTTHKYDPVEDVSAWLAFGDEGHPLLHGIDPVMSQLDNATRLQSWMMKAMNVAADTSHLYRHNMNAIMRPFLRLSPKGKRAVTQALLDGARWRNKAGEMVGRDWSVIDLQARYPRMTDREVAGYMAMRMTADTLYYRLNIILRDRFVRDNMVWLKNADESFSVPGRVLEKPPAGLSEIYDPATRTFVSGSKEELKKLYAKGGRIAELRGAREVEEGRTTTHVVVDNKLVRAHELPQTVLHKVPGWFPRIYTENYFVRMYKEVVRNGVKVPIFRKKGEFHPDVHNSAVAAFETREAAEEFVRLQKLDDAEKGIKPGTRHYEVHLDKKKSMDRDSTEDVLTSQGRLFFSKRGEHLQGSNMQGLSDTLDPAGAMERAVSSVSRLLTHEELRIAAETRFVQTFGDELVRHGDVTSGLKPGASWEAKESFGIIQLIKGVRPPHEQTLRAYMVRLAQYVEEKSPKAASWLFKHSDVNPGKALLGLNFAVLIALNAGKHLFLQASQFAMTSAIAPSKMVQSAYLAQSVILGAAMPASKKLTKTLAALNNMSPSDFQSLARAYRSTGLQYTLDQHSFLRGLSFAPDRSVVTSAFARAFQIGKNAIKAPIKVGKIVGFNTGELENLTMTWVLGFKQWKAKNPNKAWKNNPDLWTEWGAKARGRTFSATDMGSMKVQRSILATPFQFFAFQVKAWTAILKSPQFTRAERMRMAGGIALLYGAAGFGYLGQGLWDALEKRVGDKISYETKQMIENGMADWALNRLFTALGGTDVKGRPSEVAIAQTFSPLTGIDMIYDWLTDADRSVLEILGGMTEHSIPKITRAAQAVYNIYKEPDTESDEKLLRSLERFARIAPMFNNPSLLGWSQRAMGVINSRTFQVQGARTKAELIIKGLLGVPSRKTEEYWKKVMGGLRDSETEAREAGQQLASVLNRLAHKHRAEPDFDKFEEKVINAVEAFKIGRSPAEIEAMMHHAKRYWSVEGRTREDDALRIIVQKLIPRGSGSSDSLRGLVNKWMMSPLLNEQQRTELRRIYELDIEALENQEETE